MGQTKLIAVPDWKSCEGLIPEEDSHYYPIEVKDNGKKQLACQVDQFDSYIEVNPDTDNEFKSKYMYMFIHCYHSNPWVYDCHNNLNEFSK